MTRPPDPETYAPRLAQTHRTLFLSDFHLGALGCRADRILDFLNANEADTIYLVGDILDTWHPLVPHWTDTHDRIVRLLKRRSREGTRIVYLPGNHDHVVRGRDGRTLGGIEVIEQAVHTAADGRRYLVLHGDCCDARIFRSHLSTRIGSRIDGGLRSLDAWLKGLRSTLHPMDRSLIEAALRSVNALMHLGNRFEMRVSDLARAQGMDGVICGHSHRAALHDEFGILYGNCGDWVDSFTAIAENEIGAFVLLRWEAPNREPARASEFDGAVEPGFAGV